MDRPGRPPPASSMGADGAGGRAPAESVFDFIALTQCLATAGAADVGRSVPYVTTHEALLKCGETERHQSSQYINVHASTFCDNTIMYVWHGESTVLLFYILFSSEQVEQVEQRRLSRRLAPA